MSDELMTLPGQISKLLRRGSPVHHADLGSGVVIEAMRPGAGVAVGFEGPGDMAQFAEPWIEPSKLMLDLTDETGRLHASRWLSDFLPENHSERRELRSGEAKCRSNDRAGRHVGVAFAGWCSGKGWVDPGAGHCMSRIAPQLIALDPGNCRVLADGTRWVDVEALRLVCLHVAKLA
jgi:hypothetical protein